MYSLIFTMRPPESTKGSEEILCYDVYRLSAHL